jgi:ribose 5-phosphate isomerase B
MAPPKRALFSLNYESDVQHLDQHISRRPDDGDDGITFFDNKGENAVSKLARPFEKTVNNAVNQVINDTGKKVGSVEGDLHYTSHSSGSKASTTSSTKTRDSNLSIHNPSTRRAIERKYDTSDL